MCAAMLLVHALETTSTCASKQELCFNVNTQNRRERTKIKPYKVEKNSKIEQSDDSKMIYSADRLTL